MQPISSLLLISFYLISCNASSPALESESSDSSKKSTEEAPKLTEPPAEIDSTYYKMSEQALLDTLQKQTFKYFWDFAHPTSGLIRERNTSGDLVTIGGSGFGVMAILVGIQRGYITREAGRDRLLKITTFLRDKAKRYHGVWPHWLNGNTGATIPFSPKDNGGDLVETAFMVQGLLTAREYFNKDTPQEKELREIIQTLWEEIEWTWHTQEGQSNFLYWHWSENYGWEMNLPISGWNETMIVYILAVASPTYPVAASLYYTGWARRKTYSDEVNLLNNYKGGPLFFTHYSYLCLNPHFTDSFLTKAGLYQDHFERNRAQTLLNRQWCIENSTLYPHYNKDCWGLTASDDPFGYLAHEPSSTKDNGTIAPTAAISSIPYTPEESIAFIRYLWTHYGETMWGIYGFKDAFNPKKNWYASSYLAIDQGPIICMIENYRSGLLWNYFMKNKDVQNGLQKLHFTMTSGGEK